MPGRQRARAARAGASPPPTPTTAACSCSPTTSRCSRPTRRNRSPATTSTGPRRAVGTAEVVCYHHDPTKSMADLDDDEVTAVVTHLAGPDRGARRPSTASPTCSSSRTGAPRSARRTRTRTARSTPARWCTPRWPARPRSRPSTIGRTGRSLLADVVERELAGPAGHQRGRRTSSPASRGSPGTPTRCTCCPGGR